MRNDLHCTGGFGVTEEDRRTSVYETPMLFATAKTKNGAAQKAAPLQFVVKLQLNFFEFFARGFWSHEVANDCQDPKSGRR